MKSILIVDDIRDCLQVLKGTPYEQNNIVGFNTNDLILIARTYSAAIAILNSKIKFDIMFLDHDLSDPSKNTGYDIMCWLENNPKYLPNEIRFITSNPIGRQRMEQALRSIKDKFSFINLKNGETVLIDKEDQFLVENYSWNKNDAGYAVCYKAKSTIRMHRLILNCDKNLEVDHINHDKLDNRKSNLRIVTHADNGKNLTKTKSRTTSKYKGVSWFKRDKKWRSYIVLNNKQFHLGYFDNEIDAAKAYNEKAKELFGEYANLNFIEELRNG